MKTSLLLAVGALAISSLTIYKILTEGKGEGRTLITMDKECIRLGQPDAYKCCRSAPEPTASDDLYANECYQELNKHPSVEVPGSPGSQPTCDMTICIAQKQGMVDKNGVIDHAAFYENLKKQYEEEKAAKLKKNCLDVDMTEYVFESNMCDLVKIQNCIYVTFVAICTEWNDEVKGIHCKEYEELAKKCAV